MALQYIGAVIGQTASSVSTLDTSSSLNVAAGDLLVACVKYLGGTQTTEAVADTDGSTNTMTFDSADRNTTTNVCNAIGYKLAATADSSATFRVTLGAARTYVSIIVMQFRPDAGKTVRKDQRNSSTGASASASSGNITTVGTDEVVIGHCAQYYDATGISNEQINSVAATGYTRTTATNGVASAFYRIVSATFTGQATCTTPDPAANWVCQIISFHSGHFISYVQGKQGYSTIGSGSTYIDVTMDSNVTQGNLLIIGTHAQSAIGYPSITVAKQSGTATISTTGGGGGSLTWGSYRYGHVTSRAVTAGGSLTLRISSSRSDSIFWVGIIEVSGTGLGTDNVVDSDSVTFTSTGLKQTGLLTYPGPAVIFCTVGFKGSGTSTVTEDGSYTVVSEQEDPTYMLGGVSYRILDVSGSSTASYTISTTSPDGVVLAAVFRNGDVTTTVVDSEATGSATGPVVEALQLPGTLKVVLEL